MGPLGIAEAVAGIIGSVAGPSPIGKISNILNSLPKAENWTVSINGKRQGSVSHGENNLIGMDEHSSFIFIDEDGNGHAIAGVRPLVNHIRGQDSITLDGRSYKGTIAIAKHIVGLQLRGEVEFELENNPTTYRFDCDLKL